MVFSLYFNFKTAQRLGEQCFYDVSCSYNDENSACLQINHNAICECKEGFHMVTHLKPTRRTFCTQGESHNGNILKVYVSLHTWMMIIIISSGEILLFNNLISHFPCNINLWGSLAISDYTTIATDLPTLLGVITGIFVLAGLICMVLHLFSKTKYPRTRTFADAHAGPPVFFASDTG